ncbi:hypothetical protein AvCA_43270 [Azotobacter vinelandii CA]|uniref:Uncharacterized protein n=2 Tax=Azotobacter vinelandii TaxID=354 RepID=C1DFQ2_AZOVD|nr:hypothetical protein Avin_43270 [Azotobacter vinelandii DJ]AGK14391.1 hypothetical protein AvCA_43270 [Azotobacter vinelandii CA]AGK21923.1 hypothetical protein AvCA6_43270 [Azotobacter vinelandii CA6]
MHASCGFPRESGHSDIWSRYEISSYLPDR